MGDITWIFAQLKDKYFLMNLAPTLGTLGCHSYLPKNPKFLRILGQFNQYFLIPAIISITPPLHNFKLFSSINFFISKYFVIW